MSPPDPESTARSRDDTPTLRLVVPYALGLVAASLFGRAFVPAAVGTVRWSDPLLVVDGFVAQALGALSTALLAVLLVRASMSTRAIPLRIAVTVAGGLSLLVAMTSSGGVRTPDPVLFVGSAACAITGLLVAATGARRLPELGLGLAAASGLVRLFAVALTQGGSLWSDRVATLGFLLELGTLAAASAFLLRAPRRGGVAVGVAVALAAVAAWLLVAEPEAPTWVMLRHAIDELAPRPRPLGPWSTAPIVAVYALALAGGLCVARRADRGVVGAFALIVLVRAHAEVPLLGMAMSVASVALFLARATGGARVEAQPAAGRGNSPQNDGPERGERLAPAPPID